MAGAEAAPHAGKTTAGLLAVPSMFARMSRSRRAGVSEGIHGVSLSTRPHVRPQASALRDINLLADNLLQIGRHAGVREQVVRNLGCQIHQ